MNKLSIEQSESARNANSLILQKLAVVNNGKLAEQLGIDSTSFSRLINNKKDNNLTQVETICALFHILGLKLVNIEDVYCSKEIAEATRVYLANAFNSKEYMQILFK